MPTPLVSVIVPARNAEATIAETLHSVANQSYCHLEILIVDDGSTDNTAAIARDFCASDDRARLIEKENGGVASARNCGISQARGDWVAPVDADDLWHPAKIEKQVAAALRATEPPGFVYCWYHHIDTNSRVIGTRPGWAADGPALNQLASENFVGNGSALLAHRRTVDAVNGYNENMRDGCEDLFLQLLIARDRPVACVPEYLVGYRVRPDAMSRNVEGMERSWGLVYDWLRRCATVPSYAVHWNEGIRSFEFAEMNAIRGNWRAAARLLGQALVMDPGRCAALLLYRVSRLAARLVRGRRAPSPKPLFGDAGPTDFFRQDPDELARFARLLERIDERRLARLAERDARKSSNSRSTGGLAD